MPRLFTLAFDRRPYTLWRQQVIVTVLAACVLLQPVTADSPVPGAAWWGTQQMLDPNGALDDFAAVNVGQLKYVAAKAAAAMNTSLAGGAGTAINTLIASWLQPPATGTVRDDFQALNQGQLKNVARLFYDRLGLPYPWAGGSALRDDYLWVNAGQLKHVFAFELKVRKPGTLVEIPSATLAAAQAAWATLPVTPEGSTIDDFDGDGILNLQEYLMSTPLFDPLDIDGDRLPDLVEDLYPGILSKLRFGDAVEDYDGDGVMNFEEILLGLDPSSPTTAGRTDGLTDAEVLAWGLLVTDTPLVPSTDAIAAAWFHINAAWLELWVGSGYDYWLDPTTGLAAFRAEFWGADTSLIEYPPPPYDLDGDSVADWDRDSDGLPDLWEYRYAFNLRSGLDSYEDPDDDALLNFNEFIDHTHPRLADSDGDGFEDEYEILHNSDPLLQTSQPPVSLVMVGGNAARYVYPQQVSSPLVVKVMQGGLPRVGTMVTFVLGAGTGNGKLRPASSFGNDSATVSVTTGADGTASVNFVSSVETGTATVTASAGGADSQPSFAVTVVPVPVTGTIGGIGGGGSGGPTTWPYPPPGTAQGVIDTIAALADGYRIRVQGKLDTQERFPVADLYPAYLGGSLSSAALGGYQESFEHKSWAQHTQLVFEEPLVQIPSGQSSTLASRIYLVRLYEGENVDAPYNTLVPKSTSILTFSYTDSGGRDIKLSGDIPEEFIKKSGTKVVMTPEPPDAPTKRFRMRLDLVPVGFDVAKISHNTASGELDDSKKKSTGAFLPLNSDDDDYSATSTSLGSDKDQTGSITGENDLLPIYLKKLPQLAGAKFLLDIPSKVKVWKNSNRQDEVTATTEFDASVDTTVYAEGVSKGSDLLKLTLRHGGQDKTGIARLKLTVFELKGVLNVPGYTAYSYTADGSLPTGSKWGTPTSGTVKSGSTATYATIFWNQGPAVGKAVYEVNSDYIWDLEVNVVQVKINQTGNTATYNSAPFQVGGLGSAIIGSNSSRIAMRARAVLDTVEGPTINGAQRGKKFMELGLVHQAGFDAKHGLYDDNYFFLPNKRKRSSLQDGLLHWDAENATTLPWTYKNPDHHLDITSDSASVTNQVFETTDAPFLLGTFPFTLSGDQVDRLAIDMFHIVYFAVRTKQDVNNSYDRLTQRCKLNWRFDGSGSVDASGTWTLTGSGVTGDTSFSEVTNGDTIPNAAANINEAFSTETWTTENQ